MSKTLTRERMDRHPSIVRKIVETLEKQSVEENLASLVRILRESSDHFDWVGIYLVEKNNLILKAYAGEAETKHVMIPVGQGICGYAAQAGSTVIVPDVSKDPLYLMCFPSTRSEIVVPIKGNGRVLGEVDIDSNRLSAFNGEDREMLEHVASLLAASLEKRGFHD